MKKPKVIIIVGPTASGKTSLSIELARRFGGEIISADSRQVYRGLDIGTGKVTKHEMRNVPHHLLDVASPKQRFSASDYVKAATAACLLIRANKKIPIIVGGTGYYVDALMGRITVPDAPPDAALRARLEKKTPQQLFALLQKGDPRRAATIEPHNKRRLIRALEIVSALGSVPTPKARAERPFTALWIGISPTLPELEKKIRTRLIARLRIGMLAEARRLHARGLSYKRMEELGLEYRSQARYLQGRITKEEMTEELLRDIRRYAKKQRAYWKRNQDIHWYKPSERTKIRALTAAWLRASKITPPYLQ